MAYKEFPGVLVTLSDNVMLTSQNPFYVSSLGVPVLGVSVPLAHCIADAVEKPKQFLGVSLDVYAAGVRKTSERYARISESDVLYEVVTEFARRKWLYGIILSRKIPNKVERIASDHKQIFEFVVGQKVYDEERMQRLIFVPTERFTQHIWKFSYDPKNLEKIIDHKKY